MSHYTVIVTLNLFEKWFIPLIFFLFDNKSSNNNSINRLFNECENSEKYRSFIYFSWLIFKGKKMATGTVDNVNTQWIKTCRRLYVLLLYTYSVWTLTWTFTCVGCLPIPSYIPAVVDHQRGMPCHGTYLLHQVRVHRYCDDRKGNVDLFIFNFNRKRKLLKSFISRTPAPALTSVTQQGRCLYPDESQCSHFKLFICHDKCSFKVLSRQRHRHSH